VPTWHVHDLFDGDMLHLLGKACQVCALHHLLSGLIGATQTSAMWHAGWLLLLWGKEAESRAWIF